MNRRRTIIAVVVIAGVATTAFILRRSDRCSAGKFTYHERTEWGYVPGPNNSAGKWIAAKVRARSFQVITNVDQKALVVGTNLLLSTYSSRTSVWFQFGTTKQTNYWQFALPKTKDVERALAAEPTLTFMGTNAEFWQHALSTNDASFSMGFGGGVPVGGGGIRLSVGEVLFARAMGDTNIYLVQSGSLRHGWWGDVRLRYRSVAVKRRRNIRGSYRMGRHLST